MARKAHLQDPPPTGLLTLPNEILIEVVSLLRIPDIRRLGRVNDKFRVFVGDYLTRYRYNAPIFALPNELILEIAQHLGHQKDRNSLARASLRFYPLIMDYVFRHNVRYGGSSLLNSAAKRNLNRMARAILQLGGNVNTQCGVGVMIRGKRPTPLTIAALHGHKKMAKMLLEAGASHFIDGIRIPLAVAIVERHEEVALILSQELDPSDMPLGKVRCTALQMACGAKLVNLARFYLERGSRNGERVNADSLHERSAALYLVLQRDACKGDIIKREIHEDVYQIVLILLQHGVNPDIRTRAIAAKHPDPRVRNLLSKATPATEPRESGLLVGRPWIASSEDKGLTFYEFESETLPSEDRSYARLLDFIKRPNTGTSTLIEEDGIEYGGTDDEDSVLSSSDMANLMAGRTQAPKKKSEPLEPPPFSSFPPLGTPRTSAQHASQEFWAKKPTETVPRKVTQSEKLAKTEPFPQLGQPGPTLNDARKDLWAGFVKDKAYQSTSKTPQTSLHNEGNGKKQTVDRLSKKKKKWEPLLI